MPLDFTDSRVRLALQLGQTIKNFTMVVPMSAEDVIEAMCFTAGHAAAQKEAQSFNKLKDLRLRAVAALDRGIDEGKSSDATVPKIILPN